MLIDTWDISNARAKQWTVTPGHHSVNNESEWVRGSPAPVLLGSGIGFKKMKVALLVYGNGRQAILDNCGTILSRLMAPARLTLDGFAHKYHGVLEKHSLTENPLNILDLRKNRCAKLALEFNCCEYAAQQDGSPYAESASGVTRTVITNPGNILTPAVVEITPRIGLAELELTGICRDPGTLEDLPVKVKNLAAGKKIVLDGETGLMTENGALKAFDIEIWEIPTLRPGQNPVTLSSDRLDITVKYYPRYM